jgi:hypothetical protein
MGSVEIGSRVRGSGVARWLIGGAVAAATVAWSSSSAHAFELKKTPSGGDIHWSANTVTYHLDESVDDAADGASDAITAAAASWSGLDGVPSLSVVRGGGGATPGFDGLNTIFFAPKGSSIAGGALAVTVLTFDANGHALDADLIINGRYDFAVLDPSATAATGTKPISNEMPIFVFDPSEGHKTQFDLHHVMAHELGHSLGLADEKVDNTALMYLYTFPGAALPRAPSTDDTSGVASLYDTGTSSSGGSSGCGGASVSPRGPTNAASRLAFALAVGLVGWGLSRRRRGALSKMLAAASLLLTTLALLPAEGAARPSPATVRASSRTTARARVTHVEVSADARGLFTTRATLHTTACAAAACPDETSIVTYGGTMGSIHQEVVGMPAPRLGDELDVEL